MVVNVERVVVAPVLSSSIGEPEGANGDNSVVFTLHLVVKDRAPELGETVGIGTVDRKLGELTGHVRTPHSQSTNGPAKGRTLTGVSRWHRTTPSGLRRMFLSNKGFSRCAGVP